MLNDDQLLRYSRHVLLPQIDVEGQSRIVQSSVLVVGVGGLGSPAAMYLAAAGVGTLYLVDDDVVELTNLQRQIIHQTHNVGEAKVSSAAQTVHDLNPDVHVEAIAERIDRPLLQRLLTAGVDVVLDCSDNFDTRYVVNELCVEFKTPLVSAAAIGFEGQLTVFDARDPKSPCYECLYKRDPVTESIEAGEDTESKENSDDSPSCSDSGVLGPLVGVMGALQAMEAVKLMAGAGCPLVGRLQLFDALRCEWRELSLSRDPSCGCCAGAL